MGWQLTTVEAVQAVPQLANTAAVPIAWLNSLIGAATAAVQRYCKRDLVLTSYVEYRSGRRERELVLDQYPVWVGQTKVATASSGAQLPQATVNVLSTAGFPAGTGGDPNAVPPTLTIQTGVSTWTRVTYTGTTATSFTGCSGGSGTLSSAQGQNRVVTPAVCLDPNGYSGQADGAFPDTLLMAMGSQFMVPTNRSQGRQAGRGTLLRVGGQGSAFVGSYPETMYRGKLGGQHLPEWPLGEGNIQVSYTAGYYPIPDDLAMAATMLVAQLVRILPTGANLSSESLGAYSYNVLTSTAESGPELGDLRRTLAHYREISW